MQPGNVASVEKNWSAWKKKYVGDSDGEEGDNDGVVDEKENLAGATRATRFQLAIVVLAIGAFPAILIVNDNCQDKGRRPQKKT